MSFVPPTWFEGMLIWIGYIIIPIIIGLIVLGYTQLKMKHEGFGVFILIICIAFAVFGGQVLWFEQYEAPSVQEKVITVDNWQPVFGKYWGEIGGAGDLMMQTNDSELYGNTESFLFQKFDTRDVLNHLKPGGTYKIKYYGWREGFNNGVPNILSVTEVIDESNATNHDITDYMNKRSVIIDDNDWR